MIEAMDLVEVDIIGAEPAQALIDLEQDVFPRQAGAIRAGAHSVEDLGGDDHFLASSEIVERAAETSSLLPTEYRLAVSKKLMPASSAFLMNGRLSSSPSAHWWKPLLPPP